jgi:hypothetical protein
VLATSNRARPFVRRAGLLVVLLLAGVLAACGEQADPSRRRRPGVDHHGGAHDRGVEPQHRGDR